MIRRQKSSADEQAFAQSRWADPFLRMILWRHMQRQRDTCSICKALKPCHADQPLPSCSTATLPCP